MLSYPLILIALPFLSAIFHLYGVWTMRVRSWGGPRAQAAKSIKPKDIKSHRHPKPDEQKGPEALHKPSGKHMHQAHHHARENMPEIVIERMVDVAPHPQSGA